jgi:hypothetical protein
LQHAKNPKCSVEVEHLGKIIGHDSRPRSSTFRS